MTKMSNKYKVLLLAAIRDGYSQAINQLIVPILELNERKMGIEELNEEIQTFIKTLKDAWLEVGRCSNINFSVFKTKNEKEFSDISLEIH